MLRVPRGLTGAAFLHLALAVRTMAAGTCGRGLGPRPGPRERVEPREREVAEARRARVEVLPRPPPGQGRRGSRASQPRAPHDACPFLSAHGLTPRTPFAFGLGPGPAHRCEISGGGGSWDHSWGAQHPGYGMERGRPGGRGRDSPVGSLGWRGEGTCSSLKAP